MDNELLQAISDMMDKKLEPINARLDHIDQRLDIIESNRTDKKLDDLQLNMRLFERNVKRDIHALGYDVDTVIELLKIHKIRQA